MVRIRGRWQATSLLLLLIAVLLGAQTQLPAHSPAPAPLCFTSGSKTYRLARGSERADYSVRVAEIPAGADLHMQLVDDPQGADFVLVDDVQPGEGTPCNTTGAVRTVKVAERDAKADLTIALSGDPAAADYRLYVRSARFSHADAAALLAVIWKTERTQQVAATR
jgi:hypothetical protein